MIHGRNSLNDNMLNPIKLHPPKKYGKKLPCEFNNQSNRTSGLLSLLTTIARSLQLLRDPIIRQMVGNTKTEVQLERCLNLSKY